VPDGDVPNADVADGDVADGDIPDAGGPDAGGPDAGGPESDMPEADVPEIGHTQPHGATAGSPYSDVGPDKSSTAGRRDRRHVDGPFRSR
jgi:hypothetical protein